MNITLHNCTVYIRTCIVIISLSTASFSYHINEIIKYVCVCISTEMLMLLQNGETPLHLASKRGDAKAVTILTRSGANTNIKNNVSCTT